MEPQNIAQSAETLYKYPVVLSAMMNVGMWIGTVIGLGFAGIGGVEALNHVKDAVALIPIGLLFGAIFAFAARFVFTQTRSVIISDKGITALAFGKPWRVLDWAQVKRIERVRGYNGFTNVIGYRVRVTSETMEIWIDYSIAHFDAVLVDLTERAHQHQIELWTKDRAADTLAKIKAEVTDPQERKRLMKSGVVTQVQSLVI